MTRPPVPRDRYDDHTHEMAHVRREFVREHTGASLDAVGHYSVDPASLPGNIENFTGVAQVPLGVTGPLLIDGESANGEFYIPLATTEGTLVASYNRGMRLLGRTGGVKTTIVDHAMQRAPVFLFDDARRARDFSGWLDANFAAVKQTAEATTSVGRLIGIQQFPAGPNLYTRFNFTTGDAAGQNMTGKATFAACEWIVSRYPGARYILSGSMDTDKKHSHVNQLLTRGRRVVAEATLDAAVLREVVGVDPATMFKARQVQALGGYLAGSAYLGAHAANALAALFIATGQDVANVAESHTGFVYSQLLDNGDYYWSVTLPALIVGTYGGGTGLATQRECLEMLDCYGTGGADRFAEICAAVVLAGDVSLAGAVLAGDWVSSHDRLGRNRP